MGDIRQCKNCGAAITWRETVNGRQMPCNADPVQYIESTTGDKTVITMDGRTIRAYTKGFRIHDGDGIGFLAHWAYCNRPKPQLTPPPTPKTPAPIEPQAEQISMF